MDAQKTTTYYQLLCIDVDGTLLDSRHLPSPGAQDALRALQAHGILPALASGRTRVGVLPLLEQFGLSPCHIGGGGAYACGPDGALLFNHSIPAALLPRLLQRARQDGLHPALHGLDDTLIEGSNEHERVMRLHNAGVATRVADLLAGGMAAPVKVTLWGEPADLARYAAWVHDAQIPVEMIYSAPYFLELNQAGVNKGAALVGLADALGIPLARTAAIGDQYNDLSMITTAGLGIAMGNAPQTIQDAAARVAPSSDDGGLAWAIRQWILPAPVS